MGQDLLFVAPAADQYVPATGNDALTGMADLPAPTLADLPALTPAQMDAIAQVEERRLLQATIDNASPVDTLLAREVAKVDQTLDAILSNMR